MTRVSPHSPLYGAAKPSKNTHHVVRKINNGDQTTSRAYFHPHRRGAAGWMRVFCPRDALIEHRHHICSLRTTVYQYSKLWVQALTCCSLLCVTSLDDSYVNWQAHIVTATNSRETTTYSTRRPLGEVGDADSLSVNLQHP